MKKQIGFSDEYRTCFLCGRSETSFNRLEVHHIFQGSNRNKSEKYGLTVTLCHSCHNEPPYGAHFNKQTAKYLHRYGQEKCMKEQNWTVEQFVAEFGKNYLD